MRIVFIFCLCLTFACSHSPKNTRRVASFFSDIQQGDLDVSKSRVRQFPPEKHGAHIRFYFFVELKDQQGDYIDRDPSEFKVTNLEKKKVPFTIKRVLRGRYYLSVEDPITQNRRELKFEVAGLLVSSAIPLPLRQAARKYSNVKLLSKEKNRVKFLLTLADDKGKAVDALYSPEIILDGNTTAHVESVERLSEGKWQISVIYPEENQLFYISVRSLGVYFKKLFRFQHIEI